jgi:hypothetical protein
MIEAWTRPGATKIELACFTKGDGQDGVKRIELLIND